MAFPNPMNAALSPMQPPTHVIQLKRTRDEAEHVQIPHPHIRALEPPIQPAQHHYAPFDQSYAVNYADNYDPCVSGPHAA